MKNILSLLLFTCIILVGFDAHAQDKSKRPSPPDLVKLTLSSGAQISIDYSRPSVKGRIIGVDLEPKDGEVWRTGANEATVFETDKPVKINGKELPAGKYALFSISGKNGWIFIFNKTWKQWGSMKYNEKEDALRVEAKSKKANPFTEQLTFTIDKLGEVSLLWGDINVGFKVQ